MPLPLPDDLGFDLLAEAIASSHRPEWMRDALCREYDSDVFFASDPRFAMAVCGDCKVREECAAYAEDGHEMHGTWGGVSEVERAEARRRVKVEAG